MTEANKRAVANLRKRRGVAKGSVTRLIARVANLEGEADSRDVGNAAKQLLTRLQDAKNSGKLTCP